MRILLVNKFLRPVGGAETVFFDEWRWLEAAGHDVIPFGMSHGDNIDSPYARYWVNEVDYQRPSPGQLRNLIWSPEAAVRLRRLLADARPDVAHLHNIYHQLSPSILPVLAEAGVPTVMTVHDYKLVCPNYRLFTNGAPCTRCVRSHPWHAVRHRCLKQSLAASGLAALETAVHRRINAYGRVNRLIAPSQFVGEMLLRGGYPQNRIIVLPHAIDAPAQPRQASGEHILFAGRLEPEKGIGPLLDAAARLPEIPFVIAGAGSPAVQPPANARFLGRLNAAELADWRRRARAVIVPSLWYEVFGMAALEAMADGVAVVAGRIGALPELVEHGRTGLLVEPGDAAALAEAIDRLWRDPALAARLGQQGWAAVRERYAPEQHIDALLTIYARQQRGETAV